jgi:ATP-dependent DNA helicase PIF1
MQAEEQGVVVPQPQREDQSKRANVGKKWSEKDEAYLLSNHLSGIHISDTASVLQRTDFSVITRVYEIAVRDISEGRCQTLEDVALQYKLKDFEKLKLAHEKHQLAMKKILSSPPPLEATKKSKPQKSITSFMIDKKSSSSPLVKGVEVGGGEGGRVSTDAINEPNIFSKFRNEEREIIIETKPLLTMKTFDAPLEETKTSKYFSKEVPENQKKVASLPAPTTPALHRHHHYHLNADQQKAVVVVTEKRKNIFLTGEPGTGKTFTIQIIKDLLVKQGKKVAITAMTGTAAVLANAKTLHSFLGIGLGKKEVDELVKDVYMKQKEKVLMIQDTDVMIIDEVSMLDAELLHKISEFLKRLRRSKLPFGNLQMIFVGDFCQLPPVNGNYCFSSPVWVEAEIESIFLKENVRQAKDPEFAEMLRRLRWGYESMTEGDLAILTEMTTTKFPESIVPTRLFPKNAQVDKINKNFFQRLITSRTGGEVDAILCFPKVDSKDAVKFRTYADLTGIALDLELCIGTQVMITRNIDVEEGLVNGTRGVVSAIYRHDLSVDITLMNGQRAHIAYVEATFPLDKKKESTYRMMPLKYAWAISQHKCQGMTLDAIEIDLGEDIFENGQAYVALSRAEHRKSVRIVNFDRFSFKTHADVKTFYSSIV